MTDGPVEDLAVVFGTAGELIAAVRPRQWDAATTCPEWNVRELVNHMVMGNRLFAGILRGEAAVASGALDPKSGDRLGADPAGAYRGATGELLAAFGLPGVLERTWRVPAGEVPGVAAVHLRAVEDLVHGWDLAVTTGGRTGFPADIVERELAFTRAKLADVPPERIPFGPPQRVPDGAPAIDRLAALLGRRP